MSSIGGHGPRRPLSPWVPALFLFLLAGALFLPTLPNGFVFDDEPYILANPHVASGLSVANVVWAFTGFWQANWHPLTWVAHMLDVTMFGLRPAGHHFVSVLLHAANAALLFGLLTRLTGLRVPSFFVALFFSVHPLRVESVAWVAERKDLLCAFFSLLSLGAWLKYVRRPRASTYLAALGLFSAALLSKPMAITLPFLLLLLDFWPLGRLAPERIRGVLVEKAPFFLLSAVSGVVTTMAQASEKAISSSFPVDLRLANALVSYVMYLQKTLLPVGLSFFYPHPAAIPVWKSAGALALLALLTALVLVSWRSRPYLITGWLWFLGALVPVIGVVKVGSQAYADRYTYLPHVGLFIAAVFWAYGAVKARALSGSAGWRRAVASAMVFGFAATLMIATALQQRTWKTNQALYEHAIAVDPRNWLAHNNLGGELLEQGRPREAEAHLRDALAINPRLAPGWANLGKLAFRRRQYAEAEAHFRNALALQPASADAENGLGASLLARGLLREAIGHFEQALRLEPANPTPSYNLGAAYALLGETVRARFHYREALRLRPDYEDARRGLARLDRR